MICPGSHIIREKPKAEQNQRKSEGWAMTDVFLIQASAGPSLCVLSKKQVLGPNIKSIPLLLELVVFRKDEHPSLCLFFTSA